jgi:hypothetical protein
MKVEKLAETLTMRTVIILVALLLHGALSAQVRYGTRTGETSFFSETSMENISAVNHKVGSVWDVTTGQVEVSMLMKAFEFEKALMQEHFNENYVESNLYPKGLFKGKVSGVSAEDLAKPGKYNATLDGDLTLHGVTQHRTLKATVEVQPSGVVRAESDLNIRPEDHKITIPNVVRGQIAEEIQVKVRFDYQKM